MQLNGSTFIVTGGSSGLGAATVKRFHAAGARVVIADVNVELGESLASELGDGAAFRRTDVTSEPDAEAAVELASKRFGGLNGLVNCAGIGPAERVAGKKGPHRLETFTRVITVNLIGAFNMIRCAAAAMTTAAPNAAGERGVIVNTASVAAWDGQIGQAAYAASKGGIVSMTLPIARELSSFGIRICTVAPGIFQTPMLAGLPPEIQESLGKSVPFPARLGRPEEYAALAQHIVENEMLNGESIRLDGALRMAPR
ncbi:MAG TPA: 3-hydroxyacyl-CoA dehydrogenase [Polyangiaceae bacterium]|jgi:NAD(P)-dependent dehydrogenase (short-subunit alcohol dehydrogenase family)|nr:3-hydroxyacyl-CoA dehydrogenase [Polyangiaceae bacterium]